MRANQFLAESSIDPGIVQALRSKGYKPLGSKGADQQAFLEPGSGLVLKIFGTEGDSSSSSRSNSWADTYDGDSGSGTYEAAPARAKEALPIQLTFAQETFKTFADFCMANKANPFLPKFFGWETFIFNGRQYIQIRMERLFEFGRHEEWAEALEDLADSVKDGKNMEQWIRRNLTDVNSDNDDEWNYTEENSTYHELLSHLGEDGIKLLWNTIDQLANIAERGKFNLDLHSGNFMLGSDGEIVISDPFWCGDW